MEDKLDWLEVHPPGDLEWLGFGPAGESHLKTYAGRVHVEWDPAAKVTAFGPPSYFIQPDAKWGAAGNRNSCFATHKRSCRSLCLRAPTATTDFTDEHFPFNCLRPVGRL